MKGSLRLLFALITSLAFLPFLNAREFTDSKGRKIEAELIGFSGNTIVIERGGKEFTLPATKFSIEDQAYIKDWIEKHPDSVRYEFGFYLDLEKKNQVVIPGAAYDDKLKTTPYSYEMIVYNKGIGPAEDIQIRYEIYIEDFVDVRNNRYARMASGAEKKSRIQTVAGKLDSITIPTKGRHDFERTVNTEFYIDRDSGRTDATAGDKIIGARIRIYKSKKLIAEYADGENDELLAKTPWADAEPYEGPGPEK